jgi:hypothetical protein
MVKVGLVEADSSLDPGYIKISFLALLSYSCQGSAFVSWAELAPLITFICDELDTFLTSVHERLHYTINEEMEAKERDRKEKANERMRQKRKE